MPEPTPRPCPWCGKAPYVSLHTNSATVLCWREDDEKCFAEGPYRQTEAEAIAAWNAVAAKCHSHDALVAALEECGVKGWTEHSDEALADYADSHYSDRWEAQIEQRRRAALALARDLEKNNE